MSINRGGVKLAIHHVYSSICLLIDMPGSQGDDLAQRSTWGNQEHRLEAAVKTVRGARDAGLPRDSDGSDRGGRDLSAGLSTVTVSLTFYKGTVDAYCFGERPVRTGRVLGVNDR